MKEIKIEIQEAGAGSLSVMHSFVDRGLRPCEVVRSDAERVDDELGRLVDPFDDLHNQRGFGIEIMMSRTVGLYSLVIKGKM